MIYKTELHIHTAEVSDCASSPARESAEFYAAAGYSTVVVTNHMSKFTYKNKRFDHSGDSWDAKCDYYMNGYHTMVEAAAGRFHVLFGMELRSNTNDNDYLIYGMTEEFMRSCPDMMDMPLKELEPALREAGMLFFQAHPFRNGMRVTRPELLDGVEIYNGHPGHDSRNDIAELWAKKFNLLTSSGTDYHHAHHQPAGGIATDFAITSNEELVRVIRESNFRFIRGGEICG
ncbi:MAG: hypothetical protein IJC15_02925 [Clostridia bacterium]|nr:hypothetical protein [Clostridia bacterium]